MKTKRALVIGGAGYVGSEIVKALLLKQYRVMVFDDLSSGKLDRLPLDNDQLLFCRGSITASDEITEAVDSFQPDVVFHLAALHYIPECIGHPDLTIDVNITGTLNVIKALNDAIVKPKLIFTSSASVYGSTTRSPQPISASLRPCDIYGYSKMLGEHLVSSSYDTYIIARLFNVFGDEDPNPHLIPSITQQLQNKIITLGNPDSERDFIHVKDAARAFIALSEQGKNRSVYNIGSGMCYSVKQVAETLQELSGSQASIAFGTAESRKVDPGRLCADISDIVGDTDWRPSITFKQGLQTVYTTYIRNTRQTTQKRPVISLANYIAVVSDFDDTILDNGDSGSGGLHERARIEALRVVGQTTGMDFLDRITSQMMVAAIAQAPVYSSEGAFWWLLTEAGFIEKHLPFTPSHPLIEQLMATKDLFYRQLLLTQAQEIPGAHAFFELLSDYGFAGKLAIASSGHRGDILAFLGSHGFEQIFDMHKVIALEDAGKFKPHPRPFLYALKSLDIPPSDARKVLAFEDDPKGIIAAKKAGLTICALTSRFTRQQLLSQPIAPDFVADSFEEYAQMFGLSLSAYKPKLPSGIKNMPTGPHKSVTAS